MLACHFNLKEWVELLLSYFKRENYKEKIAFITQKNKDDQTALDLTSNQEITTYLENILNESNNQNNQNSQLQKE